MNYRLRQLLALAKEHALVTVCLIVILAAANISFFFGQENTELERVQNRLRNEGETSNRIINSAASLRSDAALIAAALKEIDASLVTKDDLAENLGYFYIIEDQTHALIGELRQNTPPPNETEGKFKTVPVSVTVKGSYAEVFAFLHKVETGSRLIKISAFTIHRSLPTGDSVTLSMELNMLAYP